MATEIKFVTSEEELAKVIEAVMTKIEAKKKKGVGEKLFSINKTAKLLGKSHTTIKKLAMKGIIRTTATGLISESAIEDYLEGKH